MSFFSELKRRNVVKIGATSAVGSWLIIQVADVVFPAFGAPDWVLQIFLALLVLGLPIALVLSWVFELTPEGVKTTSSIDADKSITHSTGQRLNYVIIGLLVLAVGFLLFNGYLPDGSNDEAVVQEAPAANESLGSVLPNSVAVLPFVNVSPNPDDAYFAVGLHEEVLNQLAKLRNLSVISRTSVLRYVDSDLSIPEIASELKVGTIMEGSVRYAGNRIRITTQLIDAAPDQHLWSETYDREFDDIFAIESDIAMNVANALEAEFSSAEQQAIEQIPTSSPAAYALYL